MMNNGAKQIIEKGDEVVTSVVYIASVEGDKFSIPLKAVELSEAFKMELEATIDNDDYDNSNNHDHQMVELISSQQGKIKSKTLSNVAHFLTHYVTIEEMQYFKTPLESNKLDDIVQPKWYADFILEISNNVHPNENLLHDILLAADFLNIQPLLRLAVLAVSCDITGRPVEELKHIFNVNIHDPKEQEAVQQENKWAMTAKEKFIQEQQNKIINSRNNS
mmetsp:Transcript_22397/g.21531  ORF Transcript_22397/g.21531 Transcript_22397/m.21531 type:complete len:220 (-) Transcript_22397:13-672(-)